MTQLKYKNLVNHKDEIKAEIKALIDQGKLNLYRGKIPRRNLEKLLGIGASSLMPSNKYPKYAMHRECIDELDQFLYEQGHGTVWEERIKEIEPCLEELHKKRELPLQKGKLNRSNIMELFGLPKNQSASVMQNRAPRLRGLFDKYDTIISECPDDYHGSKYTKYADKVEEILKSDDVEIYRGVSINTHWLARQLGLSRNESHMLTTCPEIMDHLDSKNREIELLNRAGRTAKTFYMNGVERINAGVSPYSNKHNRVWSFVELVDDYGLFFVEKLGTAMHPILEGYKAPKSNYLLVLNFFKWLSKNKEFYQDVIDGLLEGNYADQSRFEEAARALLQENVMALKKAGKGSKGASFFISKINQLAEFGVVPALDIKGYNRKAASRDHALSKPIKSLSEIDRLKVQAESVLKDACAYRRINIQGEDARAFCENIAMERENRTDLPDNFSEAVLYICNERLDEMRRVFSEEFMEWKSIYEKGNAYLNAAQVTGEEIYKSLDDAKRTGHASTWSTAVCMWFPKNDLDTATSNLLVLIRDKFNGVTPNAKHEWKQFWTKQYQKISSIVEIQEMLAPSPKAVVSAVALYLCESGANCAVGRTLEINALRKSTSARLTQIVGVKERSNGKPIFVDLPKKHENGTLGAVEALEFLIGAGDVIRRSDDINNKALMVSAQGNSASVLEEFTLRNHFKSILVERSELYAEYIVTPSMIRPTVLLATQLLNPANLSIAQQVAQHEDESTTGGYVRKVPWRVLQEDKIKSFTATMTLVITAHAEIDDAAKKLGISLNEWEKIRQHAVSTGLGPMCKNPLAGAQNDFPEGTRCMAVDRCVECSNSMAVAEPEAIADMIIWREALESVEEKWIDERPDRWVEVWMPWLAYFHVVLDEKMSRGKLVIIKKAAQEIAINRKDNPDYRMPEPW